MGFEFDARNFGIGYAAGLVSGYVIYRTIPLLQAARQAVGRRATTAQTLATQSADVRYLKDLSKAINAQHLAGEVIDLPDILVEPRFIPAPELAMPLDEDDVRHSVYHVIPHTPDLPYLLAPYNVETMSIEELGKGDRNIALIGPAGSGRTTALHTIALWALGRVDFTPPKDKVQEQLDAEEAGLSNQERADLVKKRMFISQRARERLAEERGEDFDPDAEAESHVGTTFRRFAPLYIHIANINLRRAASSSQVDPAEPLVRALQSQVSRVTSKTMPRNIYKRLNKGQMLIMIDGFDELPVHEQHEKLNWLQAFIAQYERNFIIVTGSPTGHGALLRAGLTAVYLRPFHDQDSKQLTQMIARNWSDFTGKRRTPQPDENQIAMVRAGSRSLSPFELTLKVWYGFEHGDDEGQMDRWVQTYLEKLMPDINDKLPQIQRAAALQLDEGFITADRLAELALGRPGVDVPTSTTGNTGTLQSAATEDDDADFDALLDDDPDDADDNLDSLFEETEGIVEANPRTTQTVQAVLPDTKEARQLRKDNDKLINDLIKAGVVIRYRGGRCQFRHSLLAAYLASGLLVNDPDLLEEKALEPAWVQAIGYAATRAEIDTAVEIRLAAPEDMLQSNTLAIAHWLRFAGAQAAWRANLLKKLGNLFVATNQYPLIRERMAAALVSIRDSSALVIFKRALRSANPDVRRLACLGMGAMQDEDSLPDLVQMLNDSDADVQLAAGMGLGAIGTEEALEAMIDALTTGDEHLRQAVAEAFAAIPDEGYPVLYDAISHDEMMLRRAAVFGLRRIRTAWAINSIYRVFLEDEQWYVRSAAQQVFADLDTGVRQGTRAYPRAESLPWLNQWALSQGDGIPKDVTGDDLLRMATQDDDAQIRYLAITTIGQLGIVVHVDRLYRALFDPHEAVRDAAQRALSNLQIKIGEALPAPA